MHDWKMLLVLLGLLKLLVIGKYLRMEFEIVQKCPALLIN